MAKGKKTGGRVAGVPNKTTAEAKAAIEDAFSHLQTKQADRKDFKSWAEDNTDRFYELIFPKLLPVQMQIGAGGGSGRLILEWQTNPDES